MYRNRSIVLTLIVLSQFLCTTLWFGGTAVIPELVKAMDAGPSLQANITIAVQLGFITGTLIYALLMIPDRFHPSKVFLVSALLAAVSNLAIIAVHDASLLLFFRFLTGFFLAGIYPVGMRIAADHFGKGLGKALGFLVGALVLGTAFPHLLRSFEIVLSWKTVLVIISILSACGGIIIWTFVPSGPYRLLTGRPDFKAALQVFRPPAFRRAAFGYFGHMWELYAFWAFLPVYISSHLESANGDQSSVALLSFSAIAIGALGCVGSGFISLRKGEERTAAWCLAGSGICCLASPLAFHLPTPLFILFLLGWGWLVVADSPMFSAVVARNATPALKGTALTIVTCTGFLVTIISIALLGQLNGALSTGWLFLLLLPGPVAGLLAMNKPGSNKDR